MQTGRVLGTATATLKHPSMKGWKMLVVQRYMADGRTPEGEPLVAIDPVGAGRGQTVVLTSDGPAARSLIGTKITPVRWPIIGIVD